MDSLDRAIINRLQDGLPVCEYPYLAVARELDTDEVTLLDRLEHLLDSGMLSRFGPMIHAEVMGGGLTLAALEVPEERFELVNDIVNAMPEVAHNYQRNHRLNMWFVIATERPEQVQDVINRIESETGLVVYNFPKEDEFYLNLRFSV